MICPSCKGARESRGIACGPSGCAVRTFRCFTCHGSGEITEAHAARIEYGELMRHDRIRRRVTQREEAARLGCGVGEWSRIEHGGEPETDEGRRALTARQGERLRPQPENVPDRHAFEAPEGWALCTRCGKTGTADVHAAEAQPADAERL
jgi:hypothetical protein